MRVIDNRVINPGVKERSIERNEYFSDLPLYKVAIRPKNTDFVKELELMVDQGVRYNINNRDYLAGAGIKIMQKTKGDVKAGIIAAIKESRIPNGLSGNEVAQKVGLVCSTLVSVALNNAGFKPDMNPIETMPTAVMYNLLKAGSVLLGGLSQEDSLVPESQYKKIEDYCFLVQNLNVPDASL